MSRTIFINTSRGEIVDENLLFEKLKLSEIENLSVDVITNEVDYKESNLFKNSNKEISILSLTKSQTHIK